MRRKKDLRLEGKKGHIFENIAEPSQGEEGTPFLRSKTQARLEGSKTRAFHAANDDQGFSGTGWNIQKPPEGVGRFIHKSFRGGDREKREGGGKHESSTNGGGV